MLSGFFAVTFQWKLCIFYNYNCNQCDESCKRYYQWANYNTFGICCLQYQFWSLYSRKKHSNLLLSTEQSISLCSNFMIDNNVQISYKIKTSLVEIIYFSPIICLHILSLLLLLKTEAHIQPMEVCIWHFSVDDIRQ